MIWAPKHEVHISKHIDNYRNNWTKTTHMRAIDVWVILCYVAVFYALMEYCLVIHLTTGNTLEKSTQPEYIQAENNQEIDYHKKKNQNLARKIETFSRVLLPLYSILFFTLYFIICSVSS